MLLYTLKLAKKKSNKKETKLLLTVTSYKVKNYHLLFRTALNTRIKSKFLKKKANDTNNNNKT